MHYQKKNNNPTRALMLLLVATVHIIVMLALQACAPNNSNSPDEYSIQKGLDRLRSEHWANKTNLDQSWSIVTPLDLVQGWGLESLHPQIHSHHTYEEVLSDCELEVSIIGFQDNLALSLTGSIRGAIQEAIEDEFHKNVETQEEWTEIEGRQAVILTMTIEDIAGLVNEQRQLMFLDGSQLYILRFKAEDDTNDFDVIWQRLIQSISLSEEEASSI